MTNNNAEQESSALPGPVADGSPARRLRDAFEPIAMHNFAPPHILERAGVPGLDRLAAYLWGRAAPMGEPSAEVVVEAFGMFEPSLISSGGERGRAAVRRDVLLRAQEEAISVSLGEVLAGADIPPVVAILRRGIDAADSTSRPLLAGLRSLAWPSDPAARLWRACNMLREHRGNSHLAASIVGGLDLSQMNILTETGLGGPLGPCTRTHGWSEGQVADAVEDLERRGHIADGAITGAGRQLRDEIGRNTDAMQGRIISAIGTDLDWVTSRLQEWSATCISAGTFKRAAG